MKVANCKTEKSIKVINAANYGIWFGDEGTAGPLPLPHPKCVLLTDGITGSYYFIEREVDAFLLFFLNLWLRSYRLHKVETCSEVFATTFLAYSLVDIYFSESKIYGVPPAPRFHSSDRSDCSRLVRADRMSPDRYDPYDLYIHVMQHDIVNLPIRFMFRSNSEWAQPYGLGVAMWIVSIRVRSTQDRALLIRTIYTIRIYGHIPLMILCDPHMVIHHWFIP